MNFQQLKDFCNSLTAEQLQQEVYLARTDDSAIKVEAGHITEEDEYFDHTDGLGGLESIKTQFPDDWEDVVADATLCPKGTVMLTDEG
jgi:hypothetical protein